MRTRLWNLNATVVAIAAAVLFIAVAAQRSGPDTPLPSLIAVSVPPADPAVDRRDKAAVCVAFATALFARDTAADRGPGDAYLRAAAYADQKFADALAIPVRQALPGWDIWAAHQAWIAVDATLAHGDVDSDTSVTVAITATPSGRDGWTGDPQSALVHCKVTEDSGRFLVSSYGIEPR